MTNQPMETKVEELLRASRAELARNETTLEEYDRNRFPLYAIVMANRAVVAALSELLGAQPARLPAYVPRPAQKPDAPVAQRRTHGGRARMERVKAAFSAVGNIAMSPNDVAHKVNEGLLPDDPNFMKRDAINSMMHRETDVFEKDGYGKYRVIPAIFDAEPVSMFSDDADANGGNAEVVQ